MTDEHFEFLILRFEKHWRLRGPCEIADFLGDRSAKSTHYWHRLLVELICIDLEFRWRNAGVEPIALEGYVKRFPELISLDQLPLDLIGEEYRVRWRWGDRPSHVDFVSRFQERRESILLEMLAIDDELREESDEPFGGRQPALRTRRSEEDVDPDAPPLSHRDFLLRRLIGAGRMGKVYEAKQHGKDHEVAVKFLRKTLLHRPEVVRRFIGEAGTIAKLHHPNIVGTQGLGRTPAGAYFIVMDLVKGSNLALLGSQRAFAVGEVIRWMLETCDALVHAHERGVVHCDLKPGNLLVDECGRIRVTDFGLARSLAGETPWAADVEGTAPFMAPEQAARCWGPIDARTDVYGIGAVLFALLTGRAPFTGRRLPDVLAQVVSAAPVVSPASLRADLPGPLSDLCRKCLAKAPEARFPTVRALPFIPGSVSQRRFLRDE